jgi:hypothetical protein
MRACVCKSIGKISNRNDKEKRGRPREQFKKKKKKQVAKQPGKMQVKLGTGNIIKGVDKEKKGDAATITAKKETIPITRNPQKPPKTPKNTDANPFVHSLSILHPGHTLHQAGETENDTLEHTRSIRTPSSAKMLAGRVPTYASSNQWYLDKETNSKCNIET